MSISYKGWVPTVNGRLSFRVIGETTYPTRAQYSNLRIARRQYIIVRQSRNLSDVLFSRALSRLFGAEGDFDFFLAARARVDHRSPDANLTGRLYVFRSLSEARRQIQEQLDEQFSIYREIEHDPHDELAIRSLYAATHELLLASCEVSADVVLHRSGVMAIRKMHWRDSNLYERSKEYADEHHMDINAVIADQFYFFVRDIAHKHQHHSPDTDTIITTHVSDGTDLSWCNDIVFSLYFHIITIKRKYGVSEQVRALGILAYIGSFERVAADLGATLPAFNKEETRQSIEASKSHIELEVAQSRRKQETARTIGLWIAGTLLALLVFVAGFADEGVPPHPTFRLVANYIKSNPWTALFPVFLAIVYWASSKVMQIKSDIWLDVSRVALYNRLMSLVLIVVLTIMAVIVFLVSVVNIFQY